MGFGEAKQQKSVAIVDFSSSFNYSQGHEKNSIPDAISNPKLKIEILPVPVLQKLERVKGDWDGISRRILELSATDAKCWLEVVYEGETITRILRIFSSNPTSTIPEVAKALAMTPRGVEKRIAVLKKEGRLTRTGATKKGRWLVLQI